MAAAAAEAHATNEELELVRCPFNNSGFKAVCHKTGAKEVAAWGPGGRYEIVVKAKALGSYGTPEEAALAVARKLKWPSGTKCDCRKCKAAAAAPAAAAAAPLSEAEVLEIVASEGLTLARSELGCGFALNPGCRDDPTRRCTSAHATGYSI